MTIGGHDRTRGQLLSVDLDAVSSWSQRFSQELGVPARRGGPKQSCGSKSWRHEGGSIFGRQAREKATGLKACQLEGKHVKKSLPWSKKGALERLEEEGISVPPGLQSHEGASDHVRCQAIKKVWDPREVSPFRTGKSWVTL